MIVPILFIKNTKLPNHLSRNFLIFKIKPKTVYESILIKVRSNFMIVSEIIDQVIKSYYFYCMLSLLKL